MGAIRDSEDATTPLARRRELRRNSTRAEALLWSLLRGRQIAGAKFRRQHKYGQYILDFYCLEHRLAIEVDGGQHFEQAAIYYDEARTRFLGERGVQVLRFTNLEVLNETESVVEGIWLVLGTPSP
ncbi:MAG: endonuclease domain-containing protein [Dehalococcoidia bacterium]|nr:endonuclease domain-containing protein [Dehalococcoidia bacterium]